MSVRVFHHAKQHVILRRVDELDVAEREWAVADHARDTLITLLSNAQRPFNGSGRADLLLELRAHLAQVVREDIVCARSVRTIDRKDGVVGKVHAGVVPCDTGIVPLGDLAQVNVGDNVSGELEFRIDAWQVVRGNNCAEHGRNVKQLLLGLRQLLIIHRAIGCAEVDDHLRDLANACTRANRLVVDLNTRMRLAVLGEPTLINRVGKGAARAREMLRHNWRNAGNHRCHSNQGY